MPNQSLTAKELAKEAGVTLGQINNWATRRMIVSQRLEGQGRTRYFAMPETKLRVRFILKKVAEGFNLDQIDGMIRRREHRA